MDFLASFIANLWYSWHRLVRVAVAVVIALVFVAVIQFQVTGRFSAREDSTSSTPRFSLTYVPQAPGLPKPVRFDVDQPEGVVRVLR